MDLKELLFEWFISDLGYERVTSKFKLNCEILKRRSDSDIISWDPGKIVWYPNQQTIVFELWVSKFDPVLLVGSPTKFIWTDQEVVIKPEDPNFLVKLFYLVQNYSLVSGMGECFFNCELKIGDIIYARLENSR